MINFYYKTVADIYEYNTLPYFNIDDVVYLAKRLYDIHYESDGSKMENWFYNILEYSSLLQQDFFQKFYDGGFSSYSGFRIKNYKIGSKELPIDVKDWKERDMSVFELQNVDDEIDIIVCKSEDSQHLIKIVNIIKILSDGIVELDFKKL